MSQNFKYLAATEGSLLIEGLGRVVMSGSMVEVPLTF